MLLLTFSLMSSYTPDEDTAQATEGHRVVRPAHGRGRSTKATLASSSSDKCRSDLKPGRGRGGRTSSRVGATSLTIGAVSEHSGRSHTFPSHPPPPPPPTHTHTLFLLLLLTFSLMSSYTPDEDTAQTTEGRRVVRPASGRGRGRGRGRSARARASFLTIEGVSDDSGKSLINTSTRPSMWFTHSVFLNVWCWHERCHSYLQRTKVLFLTVSLNFHRRRKPESDVPPAGEKESMLVFQNTVVGHTPSPLTPPPPPLLPHPHPHTLFSSCCYSHSHSCPLILQMKTLLKLQRAAELSEQHMVVVVVVVVVPGPLL